MERKMFKTEMIDDYMKKHNFTKKEICALIGITMYSFNRLYKQKIINPDYLVNVIRRLNLDYREFLL